MIINLSGIIIRMAVNDLRVMGRATQGVRLINLKDDDGIAAVAKVECEIEEIDDAEIEENLDMNDEGDANIPEAETDLPNEPIEE
jgi:DNA gyrase subunit A